MQVFVTGATGYIGTAVAKAMAAAGHEVHALAHSADAAATIAAGNWTPVSGDLRDAAGLERLAAGYEVVIHAANSGGADAAEHDVAATRALLRALRGSGRTFIYTSGIWVAGPGRSDEAAPTRPAELVAWRGPLEREILAAAPGVRSVVVRPAIVYGRGGGIPAMLARGALPVIAPGTQRWPLVNIDDLADLYVRALDAPGGSIFHGVGTSLTMRELGLLSAAAAERPDVISLQEARRRFGAFADALAMDQDPAADATRAALQWQPRGPSPVEEFFAGSYATGLDGQDRKPAPGRVAEA
jgi:nucleoside-diphosphate-sugar epimerase